MVPRQTTIRSAGECPKEARFNLKGKLVNVFCIELQTIFQIASPTAAVHFGDTNL